MTTTGEVLQPAGESESGPWVRIPESQQSVSIPRHQSFRYEVTAGDADGDLISVDCLLNGVPVASRDIPPFVFTVDPEEPGRHAVEFVARDSRGRISRITAMLTVTSMAVTEAMELHLSHPLPGTLVTFKGRIYRVHQGVICVGVGNDMWRPVSPSAFSVTKLVANADALVASMAAGILVSQDGLNWTHLGGFHLSSQTVPSLSVRGNLLELRDNSMNWESDNGIDWAPATGAFHGPVQPGESVAWVDDSFGLSYYGEWKVTTNGGRDWIPLGVSTPSAYGNPLVAVENGFLAQGDTGIYRILRGETTFTRLHSETSWPLKLYLQQVEGLTFVGKPGEFLRSTRDGVTFTHHVAPPNANRVSITRFQGEWLAVSSDLICSSPDLRTWRVIHNFHPKVGSTFGNGLRFSEYDGDSLLFPPPAHSTSSLVLRPDFTLVELPHHEPPSSVPTGIRGGARFKGQVIALHPWYHTRPVSGGDWKRAPMFPGPDFDPPFEHQWPTTNFDRYYPASLHAATADRFLVLKPDAFNLPHNYAVTSDDGENFHVHNWSGPVPLASVKVLAASEESFLAAANNGKVLLSSDGLAWSLHEISPQFTITSLLHFGGKWHAGGWIPLPAPVNGQSHQGQIWSSPDGKSWTLTDTVSLQGFFGQTTPRPAGIAHGTARMHLAHFGWMKSHDGLNWQFDAVASGYSAVQGEHPEGLLVGYEGISVIDPESGKVLRTVSSGAAAVRWLDGWPFLSSPGRLTEWTEHDPRLTAISAPADIYGVGDYLEIDVSGAEIPAGALLRLILTPDSMLGNDDDAILASFPWESGEPVPNGGRRFTAPLPPSVSAGHFRVAAQLVLTDTASDAGLQNNQIVSDDRAVEIPGYNLRLTTTGQGRVEASDARVMYPRGALLHLQAVADPGFTFRAWEGSLVSTERAISILVDEDLDLAVAFAAGHRVTVRTVGDGSVKGLPPRGVMLPGESVTLTQTPASRWAFDGWLVDGVLHPAAALNLQPGSDVLVEAIFVPDFVVLRELAFAGTPPGTDRGWQADPDGDGLTNWQEILLGTNPAKIGSPVLRPERKGDHLRLLYKRPQGRPGHPWVKAEFSSDLIEWQSEGVPGMTERVLELRDGIETIEILLPHGGQKAGYIRLATPPAP